MELKEGMYVRDKYGRIGKIMCINNKFLLLDSQNGHQSTFVDDVIKTSFNIIDLIEVRDYVNGYKVISVGIEEQGYKYIDLDFDRKDDAVHWEQCGSLQNDEIKSIVTKEQFEQISYEVGE